MKISDLFKKLTSEKGFRIVLLVCSVLMVATLIFNTVTSSIQRTDIIKTIDGIRRELDSIEYSINSIDSYSSKLRSIEDSLEITNTNLANISEGVWRGLLRR